MSFIIAIAQLETAINRSRRLDPVRNGVLAPELRAMAELYGRMIYERASSADLEQQPDHIRQTVMKWLPAEEVVAPHPLVEQAVSQVPADENPLQLPVCQYRPGEPDFDSCEACQ